MIEDLDVIRDEVGRDISPEWLELSAKVRQLSLALEAKAEGTALASDAKVLAAEAGKLCDHMESLHADVVSLFSRIDGKSPGEWVTERAESEEIQSESIQIEREMHEWKEDPKENLRDVIKALFMWRDNPVDRLRNKTRQEDE